MEKFIVITEAEFNDYILFMQEKIRENIDIEEIAEKLEAENIEDIGLEARIEIEERIDDILLQGFNELIEEADAILLLKNAEHKEKLNKDDAIIISRPDSFLEIVNTELDVNFDIKDELIEEVIKQISNKGKGPKP